MGGAQIKTHRARDSKTTAQPTLTRGRTPEVGKISQ
jgi:hypothetical protein